MAVTVSGWFVAEMIAKFNATQLGINLVLNTNKIALFTNSITPNFSSDTAYGVAPYNANEVTTSGTWPATGVPFSTAGASSSDITATLAEGPTGTMKWDANDVSVTGTTLTNARCALIYAAALAGKNAIILVNFAADANTSAGTFGITWAAGGIGTVDWTP